MNKRKNPQDNKKGVSNNVNKANKIFENEVLSNWLAFLQQMNTVINNIVGVEGLCRLMVILQVRI